MDSAKIYFGAKVVSAMIFAASMVGCSTNPLSNRSAETYESAQAHTAVTVENGVILKSKRVTIKGTTSGTLTGGGLGGAFGAFATRKDDWYGKSLVTSITTLGGSLVGSAMTSVQGYQLIIKKEKGQTISITQASKETFKVGQKVLITSDGRVLSE